MLALALRRLPGFWPQSLRTPYRLNKGNRMQYFFKAYCGAHLTQAPPFAFASVALVAKAALHGADFRLAVARRFASCSTSRCSARDRRTAHCVYTGAEGMRDSKNSF